MTSEQSSDAGRARTSWRSHDLSKANHDSEDEECFIFNDKECFICYDSQHIYSNGNIYHIPNDILNIIIRFTDVIEIHVLRFVSKYFHKVVHSVVVSNKLLPKKIHEYGYDYIAANFGNTKLYDWVVNFFYKSESFQSNYLNIAARHGNLNLTKHIKERYGYWGSKITCSEAAKGGHLEVLKWLFEDGCPWEEKTCEMAAMGGRAGAARSASF
jgi:hypothetical protein